MNDFIEISSVSVGYRSVGHVNAGIVICININVDLSQLREFMEVGNTEVAYISRWQFRGLASLTL